MTKPSDPHPDHRALARATRQAVINVYGASHEPGSEGAREATGVDHAYGSPPEVYTYRVYPVEGCGPTVTRPG